MKPNTTIAALACASALLLSVATSAHAAEPAQKAQPAKAAAKPAATKAASTKTAEKKPAQSKAAQNKPKIAKSAAKAVEEVTPVDNDPNITLSEADLEVAKRVYVGAIKCELGNNVQIDADEKHPGFFTVKTGKVRYRMHPVESRTGAVRLEDPRAGAIWIQLGNKSMLMNQKIGERLADECQGTQQVVFAEEMKKNPPKSLFEPADAPAK